MLFALDGGSVLNFVEVTALKRAFSFGRFKCSCASPMITFAEYPSEGYVLMLKKDTAKKCCAYCIKSFLGGKKLQITESEKYLTIGSP
jgi:hypothetical protein